MRREREGHAVEGEVGGWVMIMSFGVIARSEILEEEA